MIQNIGIYIVATNKYNNLLLDLFESINATLHTTRDFKITINLATDQVEQNKNLSKKFELILFNFLEIDNYGWPEATLFRYKFIKCFDNVFNFDYCMYLDVDMKIHCEFLSENVFLNDQNKITLVKHPAYNIDKSLNGIWNAITSPSIILKYIKSIKFAFFKIGAWETNKKSMAYVPYLKRSTYVHGAIWFGHPIPFDKLCTELDSRTDIDFMNGVIASWHDESHLNWYACHKSVNYLGSSYSWVKGYRHLKHVKPAISSLSVIDKRLKLSSSAIQK